MNGPIHPFDEHAARVSWDFRDLPEVEPVETREPWWASALAVLASATVLPLGFMLWEIFG